MSLNNGTSGLTTAVAVSDGLIQPTAGPSSSQKDQPLAPEPPNTPRSKAKRQRDGPSSAGVHLDDSPSVGPPRAKRRS